MATCQGCVWSLEMPGKEAGSEGDERRGEKYSSLIERVCVCVYLGGGKGGTVSTPHTQSVFSTPPTPHQVSLSLQLGVGRLDHCSHRASLLILSFVCSRRSSVHRHILGKLPHEIQDPGSAFKASSCVRLPFQASDLPNLSVCLCFLCLIR